MRAGKVLLLALVAFPALADDLIKSQRSAVERALIERDQRAAELAAPAPQRPALEALHERQRQELGSEVTPQDRVRLARERNGVLLELPPPRTRVPASGQGKPLPLPGGPVHGVDPIPSQGLGGG